MKHTFKKALALLLTLALAVPMFGVFASAETVEGTPDNLLPDAWLARYEGFDNNQATKWNVSTGDYLKLENNALTFKPTQGGNKWHLVTANSAVQTTEYSFSGEFVCNMPQNFNGWTRIIVRPFNDLNNIAAIIHLYAQNTYFGIMNAAGSDFGAKSSNFDIRDYNGKTLQFCYTRKADGTLTFSLCQKSDSANPIASVNYTITDDTYLNKTGRPEIALVDNAGQSDGTTIVLDNLRIENVTPNAVDLVGAQGSTTITDDVCSVRLIATIDSLNYSKAGFTVTAAWGGDQTNSWTVDNCVAYSAIVAYEDGKVAEYTAQDLGGKYLIAVVLQNIPRSVVEAGLTLTAEAFVISLDGNTTFYSGEGSVVATIDNNAVSLAAPVAAEA